MTDPDQPKPKIIIDEDWKTQVENEKEQAKHRESSVESQSTSADPAAAEQLPPATFAAHVMTIATQASAALGQIPDSENPDQPPPVHLDFAKYLIDTLTLLDEKTKGNLTTEETTMMENILHQLRMLYVQVSDPR